MLNHTESPIQRLSPDLVLNVALFLNVKSVLTLASTSKHLSNLVSNDLVFRRLVERDYGITYKRPDSDQTWREFYKALYTKEAKPCCPHLSKVPDEPNETKRVLYHAALDRSLRCDFCRSQEAVYLNLDASSDAQVCRSCLFEKNEEQQFPVQMEMATNTVLCFACKDDQQNPRKLGGEIADPNEQYKVKTVVDNLKEEKEGALDRRRKAEHQLYVQELRREDMSLKHYLVEKNWGRAWMMFRTREGSPLPGRISNNKLARSNGSLDPSIRLPVDKYRPSPETHADIVSEKLWTYLEKAYGVQGRAFSEDDLQYPEYARLRAYIDDFKTSILAYP